MAKKTVSADIYQRAVDDTATTYRIPPGAAAEFLKKLPDAQFNALVDKLIVMKQRRLKQLEQHPRYEPRSDFVGGPRGAR